MSKHAFIETELGLLPDDWQIVKLGEIGPFYKGAGISREDSHSGSIPAVRYGEIYTTHDNYIFKCTSFISPLIAKQSRRIHKGYILFTGSGETKEDIGKAVAFIDDYEAYAGGDIIILSPKKAYDPLYLGFFLNSSPVIRQRASLAQGDSVVHITAEALKEIRLALPPTKEEQSRIASALFDIDTLIRDLDRTIEKKQNIRQGAMEQLLSGKKRLPGFKGEWEDVELSEFGRMISGVSYKPEQAYNILSSDSTILLRSTNVQEGRIYMGDLIFVHNSCIKDVQIMRHGDILICTANGSRALVGKSALFLQAERCTFGAFMSVFRCYDSQFSSFVYYLFQSRTYRRMLEDILSGSAINNLNASQVEELVFRVPSDTNEIFAIADLLTAMDDEIAMLQLERTKYANIRSGMMDDLLSGTKRL